MKRFFFRIVKDTCGSGNSADRKNWVTMRAKNVFERHEPRVLSMGTDKVIINQVTFPRALWETASHQF